MSDGINANIMNAIKGQGIIGNGEISLVANNENGQEASFENLSLGLSFDFSEKPELLEVVKCWRYFYGEALTRDHPWEFLCNQGKMQTGRRMIEEMGRLSPDYQNFLEAAALLPQAEKHPFDPLKLAMIYACVMFSGRDEKNRPLFPGGWQKYLHHKRSISASQVGDVVAWHEGFSPTFTSGWQFFKAMRFDSLPQPSNAGMERGTDLENINKKIFYRQEGVQPDMGGLRKIVGYHLKDHPWATATPDDYVFTEKDDAFIVDYKCVEKGRPQEKMSHGYACQLAQGALLLQEQHEFCHGGLISYLDLSKFECCVVRLTEKELHELFPRILAAGDSMWQHIVENLPPKNRSEDVPLRLYERFDQPGKNTEDEMRHLDKQLCFWKAAQSVAKTEIERYQNEVEELGRQFGGYCFPHFNRNSVKVNELLPETEARKLVDQQPDIFRDAVVIEEDLNISKAMNILEQVGRLGECLDTTIAVDGKKVLEIALQQGMAPETLTTVDVRINVKKAEKELGQQVKDVVFSTLNDICLDSEIQEIFENIGMEDAEKSLTKKPQRKKAAPKMGTQVN